MTTQDRKIAAIHKLHAGVQITDAARVNMSREDLAAHIRTLTPAIRSSFWREAVERWANLVEDTENDVHWAYFQGSVWFSYDVLT